MSTVTILSTPISKLNTDQIIDELMNVLGKAEKKQICVTPVNNVIWAHKDYLLRDVYQRSHMCIADGVPLVWASKLMGAKIQQRTAGLDLVNSLCERVRGTEFSIYFLGGAPGIAQKAAENLQLKFPGLAVAGWFSPRYTKQYNDAELTDIVSMINQSNAKILFVAMTAPKQDFFIAEVLPKLNVNLAVGIGAALDYAAGTFSRPPVRIQNSGFEWFYRLLKEPNRLYRRYLLEAPIFIPLVLKQVYKERIINRLNKNE
jgi:N-acetylglucosaminyldiphosphoundecaprenol N-acetyl-beta-D-mannosaminyltransferase